MINFKNIVDRFLKTGMSVKLRNVNGRNWGWYSREDPRMHLQTVDNKEPDMKVWLENKGQRIITPGAGIQGKQLKKLQAEIGKQRKKLEADWVAFMISSRWLTTEVSGTNVVVTAYPGTHNQYERVIDLREVAPGMYQPIVINNWFDQPPVALLDEEHARLAIGPVGRNRDDMHTVFLAPVLFQD